MVREEEEEDFDIIDNDDDISVTFSEDQQVPYHCLFCQFKSDECGNRDQIIDHMRQEHNFDMPAVMRELPTFMHRVGLVNYLRSQCEVTNGDCSYKFSDFDISTVQLDDLKYLAPVLVDDRFLYELDDFDSDTEPQECDTEKNNQSLESPEQTINQLRMECDKLKELLHRLTLSPEPSAKDSTIDSKEVIKDPKEELGYYYEGYSSIDIHEQMLKDKSRTEAYRDFIYGNKHLFEGKTVLDVGCGTGILSLFCVKAGARHVYAVDNSKMIINARKIAQLNGISSDKITFLQGQIEHIPVMEKVDIIVSEWMGYFLIFEAMFDSVICARDKWLRPGGLVLPSRALIHMALVEDEEWQMDKVSYWNDVYGFDMKCMANDFVQGRAHVDLVRDQQNALISNTVCIKDIDCLRDGVSDMDFQYEFEFKCQRAGIVYSFCVWFDVEFSNGADSKNIIILSTSPKARDTHWKQVIIPLKQSNGIQVEEGTVINGSIKVVKHPENPRDLQITIDYNNPAQGETTRLITSILA